jgi:hypothetical protein
VKPLVAASLTLLKPLLASALLSSGLLLSGKLVQALAGLLSRALCCGLNGVRLRKR